MQDDAFLQAFESATLPNPSFRHLDHLRLTWLYLRRDGTELGSQRVVDGIRHFAAAHGAANRYHETLTRFWIALVQHVIDAFPRIERFDELVAEYPHMTDKSLVYRHYSAAALAEPAARQTWIAPDLRPLP